MPIRINNYAGRFGWNMRKYLPKLASTGYLTLQYMTRGRGQQKYIDWFMSQEKTPYPKVVNLETINRCNNKVAASRLIAIVSPDSAPVKRTVQEARDRGMIIDGTYGRRTRAVLIMDSDHVVLSALQPETVAARFAGDTEEGATEDA